VCRMPMTAAYAAKTPIPTEAATVARRITGIINVFTGTQPLNEALISDARPGHPYT
jgi:hypothetical protein